jgi:hypothetical protein
MTREADDALDASLADLERTVRKHKAPTRHQARAVLLALGERLLAGPAEDVEPALRRLAGAVAPDEERWKRAVADELLLACTEFIQSVDPRWLDHPRYDFHYTVAARANLEARLRAAERLELSPEEDLLDRVARADALLEPHLRRRAGKEPGN